MATFLSTRPLDAALAELAARQYGVVSLAHLEALGLGRSGARDRVASGRLHRVHRGVFAVGRPGLTVEGIYMAATLACGSGSALALGSAAHHLDLLATPCTHPVHIAAPGRARSRPGIAAHTQASERTPHLGIPTTTIDRTIVDLAAAGLRRDAERAIDRADTVHRHDFTALRAKAAQRPRARGHGVLRALLSDLQPPSRTRSGLEEAFLALCRDHGLPAPRVNMWIPFPAGGGAEADFCWPDSRLMVETDSLTFHRTRKAMVHDYARDQQLRLLGWDVVRFSWDQVFGAPREVARTVAGLLRLMSTK
jgi:very-short-patch-repair endonuclease/predicted transcriptional regulator of viral defense system